MDPYQRAEAEAHAWRAQANRFDAMIASELRSLAEEMAPAALTATMDSFTVLEWEQRLRAIAARLDQAY
jgi:hypothetical protein